MYTTISAFNTIHQPHTMVEKHINMKVPGVFSLLILIFFERTEPNLSQAYSQESLPQIQVHPKALFYQLSYLLFTQQITDHSTLVAE